MCRSDVYFEGFEANDGEESAAVDDDNTSNGDLPTFRRVSVPRVRFNAV